MSIQPPKRRGAAVLEFAIVAPFMFMLFLGIIEFGRAMMVLGVVTNSARAGARAGAVTSGDFSGIEAAVENALQRGTVQAAPEIEIQVNGLTVKSDAGFQTAAIAGASISVKVSVPYEKVSWIPSSFFLSGITLTEVAVMRREG